MPREISKYECEFCFEEYDTYRACLSHEEYCDDNPKTVNDSHCCEKDDDLLEFGYINI